MIIKKTIPQKFKIFRDLGHQVSEKENFKKQIVLNFGGTKVKHKKPFLLLNKPEMVEIASNKIRMLKHLLELAPESYFSYPNPLELPFIVKKMKGYKGMGKKLIRSLENFNPDVWNIFQEYLDIKREYRAILFQQKVLVVYRKEWKEGWNGEDFTWGRQFYQVSQINGKKVDNRVIEIAKKAQERISLDFCGIDIVKTRENEFYILEVNSSPGIGEFTAPKLIKAVEEYLCLE